MARLAEAIQKQHESTMALQQLASELVDHAMRMRNWTDKLQAHFVAPETPARARQDVVVPETPAISFAPYSDAMVLPKVLRGGPQVREG
jgi:predicted nucleic acid-binding Zn ribbon protein